MLHRKAERPSFEGASPFQSNINQDSIDRSPAKLCHDKTQSGLTGVALFQGKNKTA
jgi:hypothetical protein